MRKPKFAELSQDVYLCLHRALTVNKVFCKVAVVIYAAAPDSDEYDDDCDYSDCIEEDIES